MNHTQSVTGLFLCQCGEFHGDRDERQPICSGYVGSGKPMTRLNWPLLIALTACIGFWLVVVLWFLA